MDKQARAIWVDEQIHKLGLARPTSYELPSGRRSAWRVASSPISLSGEQANALRGLGHLLRSFYAAADRLYHLGLTDRRYAFVPEYLDLGKPKRIVQSSRHPRFKGVLPLIIRPDLLWTNKGFVATEFDSIPGGVGLLSGMESLYREFSHGVPNSAEAFAEAIRVLHVRGLLAIVVSDESAGYRDEMQYLASTLVTRGINAQCLRPEDVEVRPTGVYAGKERIATIYRFFELFDVDNVPNGWAMLEAAMVGLVKLTPPPKAYLEEKLWFALIHHPVLATYWAKNLGQAAFDRLKSLVPSTFVLDSRPLPPHGVIAGLETKGQVVSSYLELTDLPRSERNYVIKPSGFSPLAWGSRGVVLGKELTTKAWAEELERVLEAFVEQPFILQEYHASRVEQQEYYDFSTKTMQTFVGKARYCPYFFTAGKEVISGGVLITNCPVDKPLIHGMTDAVMVSASWPSTE